MGDLDRAVDLATTVEPEIDAKQLTAVERIERVAARHLHLGGKPEHGTSIQRNGLLVVRLNPRFMHLACVVADDEAVVGERDECARNGPFASDGELPLCRRCYDAEHQSATGE